MSLIDELKGLEDRVAERMKELRPLVDEYRELEQVAEKLGVSPATPGAPTPRPRSSARKRSGARSTNSSRATRAPGASRARTAAPRATEAASAGAARARSNGRRDQLLDMVKARPGITVREVGSELGVDPTSLYRIVHRLEQDGALEKRGRELMPR